ncbi:MAG: enoyl-[acyl-carrier-protein] reductase FabL [Planctomycetota bacterium]
MDIDIKGKVALVTGGSRGIGRAIAETLARAGANVAVNYLRQKAPAAETVAAIEGHGVRGLAIKANVGQADGVQEIFGTMCEEFGGVDILISNAASGVLRPYSELTPRHFDWTMDINAKAFLPLVQHAIPMMVARGGGKVVAVSSLGSMRAIPNYLAVGASKAALECIVRHVALESAGENVNVNAVSAGTVDTDALTHFPNREEMLQTTLERTPAGRLVTPDDVANTVLFLCSSGSEMIHGQTIIVDGGYTVVV